jgi:CheY-like chemotaxis protein
MKSLAQEPAEILVIDQDAPALDSITGVLQQAGHVVYQAKGRAAALKLAKAQPLDLAICDVHLGSENGLELCNELRRLPGMQDLPVMFVSSTQLPDIIRRSHDASGAYYLRKPLDPDVLIDLVNKALWLPHLVRTRLTLHQAAPRTGRPPQPKSAARFSAVQGIRLPLA